MEKIRGKVIILGDDVDTDQILPGYAMSEPYEEIGKYAMAGLPTEDFKLNREPGCILVAGRNFGCGSSREQAPEIIKALGVQCVIAKSFARIFFRNSINNGLLLIENPTLRDHVKEGDTIEVTTGEKIVLNGQEFPIASLPQNLMDIINAGGLVKAMQKRNGII